jgi:hypothetical protein
MIESTKAWCAGCTVSRVLFEEEENVPVIWIHDYHLMLAATTIRQVSSSASQPHKPTNHTKIKQITN